MPETPTEPPEVEEAAASPEDASPADAVVAALRSNLGDADKVTLLLAAFDEFLAADIEDAAELDPADVLAATAAHLLADAVKSLRAIAEATRRVDIHARMGRSVPTSGNTARLLDAGKRRVAQVNMRVGFAALDEVDAVTIAENIA